MAARETHVSFLFHMHQPLYVDPTTGRAEMPWVRLHGGRGYLDVARLLEQHPAISLTVNFVPSLVAQLEGTVKGAEDRYQAIATRSTWTLEEREFLLAHFFSVNWGRGVEPRPRYRELLEKRGRSLGPNDLRARAPEFSDEELRDLTVLFHLAWLGFTARAMDPDVTELEAKGRGYTAEDLAIVLRAGRLACAAVLPLYRKLAERGQIELSASPYYHPIVPLLVDTESARRAMPHATLPDRFAWSADAHQQIVRGRDAHARAFGAPPRGMWPPEGSVSPEALAVYRAEQIGWLATDEGNLWRSIAAMGRSDPGRGELYRPYRHNGIDLVFRDRELSDRIGFSYAFGDAQGGVDDLIGRIRHAGSIAHVSSGQPPLVAIILDGENPWEAYPGSGEPFLQTLFTALETSADVRGLSIGAHLAEHPERVELPDLHSGSWIDSDFHIWIGDPIKNRAWSLLGEARRRWQVAKESGLDPKQLDGALEHLLAAEGSDWFWWFGEPFNSAEDAMFDRLFRAHLAAAWSDLGEPVPRDLGEPVGRRSSLPLCAPRALISPTIDGRVGGYFEWIDAGRYEVSQGAAMAEVRLVSLLHYGSDRRNLFMRLDPTVEGRAKLATLSIDLLLRAGQREIDLTAALPAKRFLARQRADATGSFAEQGPCGVLAVGDIIEAVVPFGELGLTPGMTAELVVRLVQGDVILSRFPRDGHLDIAVPDDTFSARHWSV